jgi:hypothetical protein
MKKIIYSLLCLSSAMAFAQNSILNAGSPQKFREDREIKKDSLGTPIKYAFIEDKDILRSMVVWEIIDMNDKINQPFITILTVLYHKINRFIRFFWMQLITEK